LLERLGNYELRTIFWSGLRRLRASRYGVRGPLYAGSKDPACKYVAAYKAGVVGGSSDPP
jgi:hypothetical protein